MFKGGQNHKVDRTDASRHKVRSMAMEIQIAAMVRTLNTTTFFLQTALQSRAHYTKNRHGHSPGWFVVHIQKNSDPRRSPLNLPATSLSSFAHAKSSLQHPTVASAPGYGDALRQRLLNTFVLCVYIYPAGAVAVSTAKAPALRKPHA